MLSGVCYYKYNTVRKCIGIRKLSIKERRERQKLATREGILAAAREIARTDGWGAVTIRRIADAIEYTPPIIYEYFASKEAILVTLQEIGFDELAAAMSEAGKEAADQTERIVQMGLAYLRFSRRCPEMYQVMHGRESAALPMEDTLAGARKTGAIVQEALQDWAAENGVTLADPQGAVETLWALLLGLVTIRNLDRLGGGPERGEQLAAQASRDLLFAWAGHSK